MGSIVIVRSNSIIYDPRVRKIANSLNKKYSVITLGWNREGVPIKQIKNNHPTEVDIFNLKSPYGKTRLVAYFPLFWFWVFFKLIFIKPFVIHACDLDTVIPCYLYKIIFRKKLIFDVFDRYAFAYVPKKFKNLYNTINNFEERISSKVDILITVAENIQQTFLLKPKRSVIIRNCPERQNSEKRKKNQNVLTLVYTGAVVSKRGLERIADAIKNLNDVQLVFAGRVLDKKLLNDLSKISNIKYEGLLKPEDALALEAMSDVMVILYDLDIPIHKVANPNKTFEAMMFGIPLITNVTPQLIKETECGILVDYNNLNEIRTAIINLRDNEDLRLRLGENGKMAFEEKYSWDIMEKKLYKIYDELL